MIFLPTELLSQIFDCLTNKQDQISSQLVCHAWHTPAKRAFYKHVVIIEAENDKTYPFLNFIQSMWLSISIHSDLPLPGQFVKTLRVDFHRHTYSDNNIPRVADFQLLGMSCPNVEEFAIPTLFWGQLISSNMKQYWTKLNKLPSFQISQNILKRKYELDRFFHFQSSLTHLEVTNFYIHNLSHFSLMIQSFTALVALKITTNKHNFTQMMPMLKDCPNITEFSMTTTSSIRDLPVDYPQHPPRILGNHFGQSANQNVLEPTRLQFLDLNVRVISFHLINTITQTLPCLQKLVLRVQEQSPVLFLDQLSRFITTQLSQSTIHFFLPPAPNDPVLLIKQYISSSKTIVNMSYDSRSSVITGVPDISYHQHDQCKRLYLRFQGSILPTIKVQDLIHMKVLKEYGIYIHRLEIQFPSFLQAVEKKSIENPASVQSLFDHCPNISILSISQCYFDLKLQSTTFFLHCLTLDKSLITAESLYHISCHCIHLRYLTLQDCDWDHKRIINMPKTEFKKLSILKTCDNRFQKKVARIIVLEPTRTTTAFYCVSKSYTSFMATTTQPKPSFSIKIICKAMDQFRFNHVPLVLS
ncbi:uncharacterized protein EV154DRAFT_547081 [Mucor mucedo]|uniref:uncharacterized protein n=1 Tax=Mucor mucedo TaxID=29922 RepID=UPI00221FF956|nr:uncharacterized protein EV154DRAFT_547081 [Mucor mucedo]KAI7896826.1 hypothetical protein EV154DRAFT_547081 [Mucor mucedo]